MYVIVLMAVVHCESTQPYASNLEPALTYLRSILEGGERGRQGQDMIVSRWPIRVCHVESWRAD
jgi:hypothetical protein